MDSRNRIRIPTSSADGLAWLTSEDEAKDVLGSLERPGVITLLPWDPYGMAVLARHQELEGALEKSRDTFQAIAELGLLYVRLLHGIDGMITLPDEALYHLHAVTPQDTYFVVVRTLIGLELWSRYGHFMAGRAPHALLADLKGQISAWGDQPG